MGLLDSFRAMKSVDTFRLATMFDLRERTSWPDDVCACASLALHPFDDQVRTGRAYRESASKAARAFARTIKQLTGEAAPETDADAAVKAALLAYRHFAFEYGESYYQTRFDQAIGASPTAT